MSKIKYFRNFILCGDLNSRCLICKENCHNQADLDRHLRWEKHRKGIKSQTCMSQFSKDSIYKIDPYYYCSFCNIIVQDIVEIKQHVSSDIHKNNKTHPMGATTRVDVKLIDEDVFINGTLISSLQWQGIIDKQCILCNVSVKELSSHLYSQEHYIKLIQARVNYVDDKYYRKTDKHHFQCFTCQKAFSMLQFDDHFMNHSNNNSIEAAKTVQVNIDLKQPVPTVVNKDVKLIKDYTITDTHEEYPMVLSATAMDKIRKTEWDIEILAGIAEDEYFEINMEAKRLTCKDCKKDIKISNDDITNHLHAHGNYNILQNSVFKAIKYYIEKRYILQNHDHGAARSQAAQYGIMNFIKMNAGGSKGYCTLCDKFLSASIGTFKMHVAGSFHKGHLELKGMLIPSKHEQGCYMPVLMIHQIKSLLYSADKKTFLVNDNWLICEDSFFLMKRIEHGKHYKKTKCFACDETILPEDEKEHCISWKHKSNLLAAKTISEDCILMREIRPRLYHCGVCNETLPYWESFQNHCKQLTHGINYKVTVPPMVRKFGFSKEIVLKTNNDNLYMQLLNAVFNTKYVIKLD